MLYNTPTHAAVFMCTTQLPLLKQCVVCSLVTLMLAMPASTLQKTSLKSTPLFSLTLRVLKCLRNTMSLHFRYFLCIDMTHRVGNHPLGRRGLSYLILSTSWLLMTWQRMKLGHQQLWYWSHSPGISHLQNQTGYWRCQVLIKCTEGVHNGILQNAST